MIFLFIVLQFPECTVYSRYNKKKNQELLNFVWEGTTSYLTKNVLIESESKKS